MFFYANFAMSQKKYIFPCLECTWGFMVTECKSKCSFQPLGDLRNISGGIA